MFILSLSFLLGQACVCAHVYFYVQMCVSGFSGRAAVALASFLHSEPGDLPSWCLWLYIGLLNGHQASYGNHHGRKEVLTQ